MNVLVTAAGGRVPAGFPLLAHVLQARSTLRNALEQPYRKAFGDVSQRTGRSGPAREQWRGARVWMLGGGSLSPDVCKVFSFDPFAPTHQFSRMRFNDPPSDLQLPVAPRLKPEEMRISLPVAYGLSVPGEELPREVSPGEIAPIRPIAPRPPSPSFAGIYEK